MAIRRNENNTTEIDVEILMDPSISNKTYYKFPIDTLQDLALLTPEEAKDIIESLVVNNDQRVKDFLLYQESQKSQKEIPEVIDVPVGE